MFLLLTAAKMNQDENSKRPLLYSNLYFRIVLIQIEVGTKKYICITYTFQ